MSSNNFNPTRGMRDFMPAEMRARQTVADVIRNYYTRNGFLPIGTPLVENKEFLSKGNEESENAKLGFDVVSSRSTSEEANLGLRYDLTVPLARFYAANKDKLPSPFRSFQTGEVFRAERPQRGRYRQFTQCDIDVLGDNTVMAEIDILSTALSLLEELGLKNVTLVINDKSFLTGLLLSYGFGSEALPEVLRNIDKFDKMPKEKIRSLLEEKYPVEAISKLFTDVESIESMDSMTRLNRFPSSLLENSFLGEILSYLNDFNVNVVFNPFLARGMDYYTGTIFEIKAGNDNLSIAAGGRYDKFKGNTSAVGLSLGFERIVGLVKEDEDARNSKCLLVYDRNCSIRSVLKTKQELIVQGFDVTLQPKPKNLPALLTKLAPLYGSFAMLKDEDDFSLEVKEIKLVN